MNPNELDEIVNRANATLKTQFSGYSGCDVKSYNPPVVEYFFTDHISANTFCLNKQTGNRKAWMGSSEMTVLEEWQEH